MSGLATLISPTRYLPVSGIANPEGKAAEARGFPQDEKKPVEVGGFLQDDKRSSKREAFFKTIKGRRSGRLSSRRKKARRSGLFRFAKVRKDLGDLDFLSLQALLALGDDERDALAFLQGLEARALDRAEMHEQVVTAFRGDEAKTFGVVEPLDCTALTIRHVTYL